MSLVRKNIAANYAGKIWSAAIQLALVPLYVNHLGMEAYGLIGFFVVLQSVLSVLDMGLGTTTNREISRLTISSGNGQAVRNLAKSVEALYLMMAGIIAAGVIILHEYFAARWVQAQTLPTDVVQYAMLFIGLTVAAQWPVSFYSACMTGMQRQVLNNVLQTTFVTIRSTGSAVVVLFVPDPVKIFFMWNFLCTVLYAAGLHFAAWRVLPLSSEKPRMRIDTLRSIWRFAASMSILAVLLLAYSQIDKIIVSRFLPLGQFGAYSIAAQISGIFFLFYYPVYTSLFPALTQAYAVGDMQKFKRMYFKGSELIALSVIPVAAMIICFSDSLLYVWIGDKGRLYESPFISGILVFGAAAGTMPYLAYAMQQATGRTRVSINVLLWGLSFAGLTMLCAIKMGFGARTIAAVWAVVNLIQSTIIVFRTHWQIFGSHLWDWVLQILVIPISISAPIAYAAKAIVSNYGPYDKTTMIGSMLVIFFFVLSANAIALPSVRSALLHFLLNGARILKRARTQ